MYIMVSQVCVQGFSPVMVFPVGSYSQRFLELFFGEGYLMVRPGDVCLVNFRAKLKFWGGE